MNNAYTNQQPHQNKRSNSKLKTILKWWIGLSFLYIAIMALSTNRSIFSVLPFLLAALITIPFSINKIENVFRIHLSRLWKYILVFTAVSIGSVNFPTEKEKAIANNNNYTVADIKARDTSDQIQKEETTDSVNTSKSDETEKVLTKESEEKRIKKIEKQFSSWTGAHIKLERYIKRNMNDPDSYEHIATNYWDKGSYILVATRFRGNNSFGAKVINNISAKVDLDGNIIEIITPDN